MRLLLTLVDNAPIAPMTNIGAARRNCIIFDAIKSVVASGVDVHKTVGGRRC